MNKNTNYDKAYNPLLLISQTEILKFIKWLGS